VPTPDTVLAQLEAIANDWRSLAIVWHFVLFSFVGMLLAGWRPSVRAAACLLIAPLVSVSTVAWLAGNPFNGSVFLGIAAVLAGAAWRFPDTPVNAVSPAWVARGAVLVAFGAVYPHFLRTDSWPAYLYAAPLALLPCPTLSVVIGVTVMVSRLRAGIWGVTLLIAGLVYGIIGVFVLGVGLDYGLLIGTALLAAAVAQDRVLVSVYDELLERFIPVYDVVERHHIRVAAPAAVTLAAARDQDLFRVPLIRAIFRAREIVMRATPGPSVPQGLLAATQAMGWGILAETPGREVVVGAVTRPWEPNVSFRALPPGDFAAFAEPGFVKIAWTLRADPIDENSSVFRTETRAIATDDAARGRFRWYWAFASPGIAAIRWLSLRPLRRAAERRSC
jgi:hypothetical protein